VVAPSVRLPAAPRRLHVPPAAVLAAALPLVLLHGSYQPSVTIGLGPTSATATLSDLGVLAAALAGLWAGVTRGFAPLLRARGLWVVAAAFLALAVVGSFYAPAWEEHLVTAAKFVFYASLAPAAALLLRARDDLRVVLAALVAWSCAATVFGVLQFLGFADDEFRGRIPGERVSAFLGPHDFAALSGVVLALALAAIALGTHERRAWVVAAGVSGGLGLVLSGAAAGLLGIGLAAVAAGLVARSRGVLTWRGAAGLAAVVGAVAVGVFALRAADVDQLLKFLGITPGASVETLAGSSYSQRAVLAYIGLRIYLDHPVAGVGWQGSAEEEAYRPYLDDAHARFPDVEPVAFPSPEHEWGVQNAYLQTAADLGTIGLLLLIALAVAGVRVALRASRHTVVPLLWLLVLAGIWNGLGLVAGLPLEALTWLALGAAAAADGWADG